MSVCTSDPRSVDDVMCLFAPHKPTGVSGDVVLHDDLESVPQFAGDVVEDLEVALEPVRPATVNVQQELNRSGPRAASATTVHSHP